jgi:hypothetical protein
MRDWIARGIGMNCNVSIPSGSSFNGCMDLCLGALAYIQGIIVGGNDQKA